VHQAVFADVEVARSRAAAPVVLHSVSDVVLKPVKARVAALFHGSHGGVSFTLLVAERLQLPAAIVDNPHRGAEPQFERAPADRKRVPRVAIPPPTTELMFTWNSACSARTRSFRSSVFRLLRETSSGIALSIEICRWSSPRAVAGSPLRVRSTRS